MKSLFRKIKNRLFPRKIELLFFIYQEPQLRLPSSLQIVTINQTDVFLSDKKIPTWLKNNNYMNRLHRHDRFIYLCNEKNILSWGWVFGGKTFYLFEIDRTSCHHDNTFLYDFFTPEEHRNNGYYAILLSNAPSVLNEKNITVGAAKDNIASIRGIQNAGYVPFRMKFCDE